MAGEIEQYLMDKFQKGIESNNISSSNSSKIPLLTKFQAVQKLLDQILNSPPQPAVDPFSSLERLILRDDGRFKAAAIIGAEGVGKTTLCETVFNMEKVKSRFSPRAWVSSTSGIFHDEEYKRNPRIAFARRILASLGVESEMVERVVEDHGLRGLVCALHLELIGKRYLIVLDDARETDPWYGRLGSCLGEEKGGWEECLGYGLPKGSGGMVIVTSRNEGVAKRMIGDEGSLIPVLPLSDGDSCWKIFKDTVEKDGLSFSPLNEEELKREVLEKCGGIPLGAKMLGMAMYEQLQKANLVHQRHQYPSVQKH
ncbi:NB-ARC domain containing protein [Parasponia andersonii]|uniref:NB-ARC domain containing protein n=1 Tax=Parasponia andersonii TaxID=3476 RepID=A0A2P5BKK4_PARAD|nr:NB-ARC domain containing protein [Parasponia andersonii]